MKQPVRLFSIGLMTAGMIMLIVFMVKDPTAGKESMSTDDMIAELENEQYHVLSEEDYIALSVDESDEEEKDSEDENAAEEQAENDGDNDLNDNDSEDNEASDDEEQSDDEQDSDDQTEKSYTMKVEQGMSSREISRVLEQNNIIDDQEAFNDYLQENDYGQLIQLGKSDVNSSMSFHELAETLSTF